jgi:hypothetical protein
MTNDIKYLSNGKKVAVIGKLNNEEFIVQEIFITEQGDEIPSGERFTTRSLHSEPVLSYQEKQLLSAKQGLEELDKKKDKYKKEIDDIYQKLRGYQAVLGSTEKLAKLLPTKELNILTMFLTGTIEYLVMDGYQLSEPVKMIDKVIGFDSYYSEKRFESIKLVSVLGRSEGEIAYQIHDYSDYSGGSIRVYPFATYAEALSFIEIKAINKIEEGRLTKEEFDLVQKLEIVLPKESLNNFKEQLAVALQEQIKNREDTIYKTAKELEQYHVELKQLKDPK